MCGSQPESAQRTAALQNGKSRFLTPFAEGCERVRNDSIELVHLDRQLAAEVLHDLAGGVEGGGGGWACAGVSAGAAEEEAANGRAIAGPAD